MAANGSNNTLINDGVITTDGPNSYGMTASWGQSGGGAPNNTLINNGTITTAGSNARGISILGSSGTIINEGTVTTTNNNSHAIYAQGDKATIINKGYIEASGTTNSAGIFSNTLTSSFSAYIENHGTIISQYGIGIRTLNGNTTIINSGEVLGGSHSISMGNGNDTLILTTGSKLQGLADGGGGTNLMFLQGSGKATNDFTNFETLTMEGNAWEWSGSGAFNKINISTGNFQLMSTITGTQTFIQSGARLSGIGTLIGDTTNNGTIQPGLGDALNALTLQGNYIGSSNATLDIYSVLGDDSSNTSKLILDGGHASGKTKINVINFNGVGNLTNNGILVIQTSNGATTESDAFTLSNRVVAGVYEYTLRQGTTTDPTNQNWYLGSTVLNTGLEQILYRPEPGSYLNNQSVSALMFMHTLRDRAGAESYKVTPFTNKNIWLRVVKRKTNSKSMGQKIDVNNDSTLIHFGADLINGKFAQKDQWVLGLMGAYGYTGADAKSKSTKYKANSTVNGYSMGAYFTWQANAESELGLYTDTWLQHAWYKNKVDGKQLKQEKYDSTGWTVSTETGYKFAAINHNKYQLIIEPQLQIAYNNYKANNHTEKAGTRVTNSDATGIITRVGTRIYPRSSTSTLQPFVEFNWWHNSAKNTLNFNSKRVSDGTPNSRYEAKIGLQGEIAKNWQIWGHFGTQLGRNKYSSYEGMLGIKKQF